MQNEKPLSEAGEWYRDRDEWLRHLVVREGYTTTDRLVGVFLAMHMNRRDNHAKHMQATIARELHISQDTVKRAIRRMRDDLLIDVDHAVRGRRGRATNHYRLIFSWSE